MLSVPTFHSTKFAHEEAFFAGTEQTVTDCSGNIVTKRLMDNNFDKFVLIGAVER
jgi:hypothetical protein